jgi:adenosyl cobinamide kinase/adenosyl cobinamide phosphate guanylyltransferase
VIQDMDNIGFLKRMGASGCKIKKDLEKIQSIHNGNYKFSIFVLGALNSGKSTFLNSLLDISILPISSATETAFITIIHYDETITEPLLFKTTLKKSYDFENQCFVINDSELEATNKVGTAEINQYLKECNEARRRKWNHIIDEVVSVGTHVNQFVQEETIFVIKAKIPWLRERFDAETLRRIQFVDLPGLEEADLIRADQIRLLMEATGMDHAFLHIVPGVQQQSSETLNRIDVSLNLKNRNWVIFNKIDQMILRDYVSARDLAQEEASKHGQQSNLMNLESQISPDAISKLYKKNFINKCAFQNSEIFQLLQKEPNHIFFLSAKKELLKNLMLHYNNSKDEKTKDQLKELLQDDYEFSSVVKKLNKAKKTDDPIEFFLNQYQPEYESIQIFEEVRAEIFSKISEHLQERYDIYSTRLQDIPNELIKSLNFTLDVYKNNKTNVKRMITDAQNKSQACEDQLLKVFLYSRRCYVQELETILPVLDDIENKWYFRYSSRNKEAMFTFSKAKQYFQKVNKNSKDQLDQICDVYKNNVRDWEKMLENIEGTDSFYNSTYELLQTFASNNEAKSQAHIEVCDSYMTKILSIADGYSVKDVGTGVIYLMYDILRTIIPRYCRQAKQIASNMRNQTRNDLSILKQEYSEDLDTLMRKSYAEKSETSKLFQTYIVQIDKQPMKEEGLLKNLLNAVLQIT